MKKERMNAHIAASLKKGHQLFWAAKRAHRGCGLRRGFTVGSFVRSN
jgi:hypothetical protein